MNSIVFDQKKQVATVSIAALQMFLCNFQPGAIEALMDLCHFALSHRKYGKRGYPGGAEFLLADDAIEALECLFGYDTAVERDEIGCPPFEVDAANGAIIVPLRWMGTMPSERYEDDDVGPPHARLPILLGSRPEAVN
jgi:hypothetical protein